MADTDPESRISIPEFRGTTSKEQNSFASSPHESYARENGRRAARVNSLMSRTQMLFDPTGIKRERANYTQSLNAPCDEDLWFTTGFKDNFAPKESLLTDITARLGITVIRNVFDVADEQIEDVDPTPYIAIYEIGVRPGEFELVSDYPLRASPSGPFEAPIGWVDFLIGGTCATNTGILVGEKTYEFGEDVILLTDFILSAEGVTLDPTPILNPFTGKKVDPAPLDFVRKWLYPSDVFPWPGEFLAYAPDFLVAPWVAQLTDRVIYSGQYIETQEYTSGRVIAVNDIVLASGKADKTYDLLSRGQFLGDIPSSDFATYEIGDRVAIMKGVDRPVESMKFYNMKFMVGVAGENISRTVSQANEIFKIVPITFYGS